MSPETTPIFDQTIAETLIDPFAKPAPPAPPQPKRPTRKRKTP